jgi:hypothetical protein
VIDSPPSFDVLYGWNYETYIGSDYLESKTDITGWSYSSNFRSLLWTSKSQLDSQVRQKKWFRILVSRHLIEEGRILLESYFEKIVSIRSLNEHFVHRALRGLSHKCEVIMEVQRSFSDRHGGSYTNSTLLPHDPPPWSCGAGDLITSNPFIISPSSVVSIEEQTLHILNDLCVLHDFIFVSYPDRSIETDSQGWQYAHVQYTSPSTKDSIVESSITCPDLTAVSYASVPEWVSVPPTHPHGSLRRRLWMRTLVPHYALEEAQQLLSNYTRNHPRGNIRVGELMRLSVTNRTWKTYRAVLSDRYLRFYAEHEPTPHHVLPLDGLEIFHSGATEYPNSVEVFGLRKKSTTTNCTLGIFSSSSGDVREWIAAIAQQLVMLDLSFRPLYFGPIISDPIILCDDMWKRGDSLHLWSLRSITLHQSGELVNFHGATLKGKVNITGCSVKKKIEKQNKVDTFIFVVSSPSLPPLLSLPPPLSLPPHLSFFPRLHSLSPHLCCCRLV